MKCNTVTLVVAVTFTTLAALAQCIVNDPDNTSCGLPEFVEKCAACTGSHCGGKDDFTTTDVLDTSGTRKTVKSGPSGKDTTQQVSGDCKVKISFTCDGIEHTEWQGGLKDILPAGAKCPKG